MLRLARNLGHPGVQLVVSVRSPADLYYRDELPGPDASVIYTREAPTSGRVAHLSAADLAIAVVPDATAYVCGSARFADAASELVLEAGFAPGRVRVERFGPTG
jgi:ferredoxin-NADP reductase